MKYDMTQGNLTKALISFTVPLILSSLLQQIFNWVDAFIVGNVEGELSLAAIGATTIIYNLFVMVITGFTAGLAVLSAQWYGKGAPERLKEILSSFTVLLGVVFLTAAILGAFFTEQILRLLDTPANIFTEAQEYLQILFIGVPFLAVYNTYSAVLRGLGDSKAPFFAILVCSVANGLLDLLLVAVMGYGVVGAAVATAASQCAMTVVVVVYAVRHYPILRFRFGKGMISKSVLRQGSGFGAPPAIQSATNSFGNILLQRFMNGFGEKTVAAITTAYRVDSVILLPIINLGSGIATVVAQNIGAGQEDRAKKTLKIGLVMVFSVSVCLTVVVLLFGESLIAMFGLTRASVEIGSSFFHAIASCYFVYGLSMALRGYLEGIGDMLFSGAAAISALAVRIAASYVFAAPFGNMVIAYAEAFSWIVLLAIYICRVVYKIRVKNRPGPAESV